MDRTWKDHMDGLPFLSEEVDAAHPLAALQITASWGHLGFRYQWDSNRWLPFLQKLSSLKSVSEQLFCVRQVLLQEVERLESQDPEAKLQHHCRCLDSGLIFATSSCIGRARMDSIWMPQGIADAGCPRLPSLKTSSRRCCWLQPRLLTWPLFRSRGRMREMQETWQMWQVPLSFVCFDLLWHLHSSDCFPTTGLASPSIDNIWQLSLSKFKIQDFQYLPVLEWYAAIRHPTRWHSPPVFGQRRRECPENASTKFTGSGCRSDSKIFSRRENLCKGHDAFAIQNDVSSEA